MTNKEKVLEAYKKYVGEFDYEAITTKIIVSDKNGTRSYW